MNREERIQIILKENPDFKLSTDTDRRARELRVIEKQDTKAEHAVKVENYIADAKNQTKTNQFLYESRIVQYVEEFYPKYCKVSLSPDQINDIRLLWKDYRSTETYTSGLSQLPIAELEKQCKKQGHNEIILCEECNCCIWNTIEQSFDFYMMERIGNNSLFGTKDKTGKETTILFHNDADSFDDFGDFRKHGIKAKHEPKNRKCDMCHVFMVDQNFKQDAYVLIELNPQIEEKLSEELLAQKYNSTDITHLHVEWAKDIAKVKKIIAKGKSIPDERYVLLEKGLKINKDHQIVPIKGYNKPSAHVAIYSRIIQDKAIKDSITRPRPSIKVLEENMTEAIKYDSPIKIFSCGWGMDSVTEIVLNHAFYDVIIFADTGNEQDETYDYIRNYMATMPKVSRYKVRIVHSRLGRIYDFFYKKRKTPSFTQRDCTEKFKITPIKDYIKSKYRINPMTMARFLKKDANGNKILNTSYDPDDRESKKYLYDHQIELGLGINIEEAGRRHDGNVWFIKNYFPLIDKKITKKGGDETLIIKTFGHPLPRKSGCTFCLYSNKPYWLRLRREHPDQYDQAVKFYENAKDTEDNNGMKMQIVVFPTEEEFEQYMNEFATCGDGEIETGCQCMTGNMKSGEERDREFDEGYSTKPAYGGGF